MASMLSLYTTLDPFMHAEDIAAQFPEAKSSIETNPDGTWTKLTMKWPAYSLVLNYRGLEDPEMAEHLNGFAGFVWQATGQKMDAHTFRLIQKIKNVKHSLGIVVEPDIDDADEAQQVIGGLAEHSRALMFVGSAVTDWNLKQLSGPPEERDAEADFGEARDAAPRRERSNAALRKLGVGIAKSLPPLLGEDEIRLRSPEEILERVGAICICAARAEPEGLSPAEAMDAVKRFGVKRALSPEETAFLSEKNPDEATRTKFCWRYECVPVLLWAIQQAKDLPFPKQIVDVPMTARKVSELCSKRTEHELRPAAEILDAADLTYRIHWATVDHRSNGGKVPTGGANEEIVMERHYAFNWLIGLRNEAWDDVETDT